MSDSKNFIGTENDSYVFQEVENGLIRGFTCYCIVETVNEDRGLEAISWLHSVSVESGSYKSGEKAAPVVAMPEEIEGLYEMETYNCDECGAAHECEQYGDKTYVIIGDCSAYCKDCVKPADILVEIVEPSDLFKARDMVGMEVNGYEEVETLFCDSSGFGWPGERAYTKKQALERVKDILAEHSEPLYAGITDMGQFQVYVTLYRKAA